MSERAYRQRLEADIARWQSDGIITPAAAAAIRGRMPPEQEGVTVTTVVAIVGGLLIAAAFLAFIAANWTAIARPARFGLLLAGIGGAYLLGAIFDRSGRPYLSDLSAAVGCIVFGAAIALTGQMYHLGDDFAGGMLLLAIGSLVAAVLTASRGALAVALVAACIWNSMRVFETSEPHLPFIAFWLIAAGLAVVWNASVARHLVALAALSWLVNYGIAIELLRYANPNFAICAGASLLVGAGLVLASRGSESLQRFGLTLSTYGSFALANTVAWIVAGIAGYGVRALPMPILIAGGAGAALAFLAAVLNRRAGPGLAGVAIALALVVAGGWMAPTNLDEPWLVYALALASMLCLVISGMVDDVRPRMVAGWIGLALTISAVTWAVKGSLLHRAAFLAAAGLVAIALAALLGRIFRKAKP